MEFKYRNLINLDIVEKAKHSATCVEIENEFRGVNHSSATCQIYCVIQDLPVLSPERDIFCFAQERETESSKNKLNHRKIGA